MIKTKVNRRNKIPINLKESENKKRDKKKNKKKNKIISRKKSGKKWFQGEDAKKKNFIYAYKKWEGRYKKLEARKNLKR